MKLYFTAMKTKITNAKIACLDMNLMKARYALTPLRPFGLFLSG